jgi:hypothetical protein
VKPTAALALVPYDGVRWFTDQVLADAELDLVELLGLLPEVSPELALPLALAAGARDGRVRARSFGAALLDAGRGLRELLGAQGEA